MVYCALPPWRLVRLQGRVASAASYPAWPVTEKARPKVLAFLCLWWILLGIKDEPSELSIDFEACGGTSCKGDRMVMGAGGCPLMAGGQACMTAPEAFLRVLKPAASPLRNLRSCRRMTGGVVCPPPIRRPWRGRPPSSRLSLGDPYRVDFHLVFYPLVTPLRRADQGLSSDEAAGFTSCAGCDRHFLISNGSWGHNHGVLRTTALAVACTMHHDYVTINQTGLIKRPAFAT